MSDQAEEVVQAIENFLSKLLGSYGPGYELDGRVMTGAWAAKSDTLMSLFLLDAQRKSAATKMSLQTELHLQDQGLLNARLVPQTRSFVLWSHMLLETVRELWLENKQSSQMQSPISLKKLMTNWANFVNNKATLSSKQEVRGLGAG